MYSSSCVGQELWGGGCVLHVDVGGGCNCWYCTCCVCDGVLGAGRWLLGKGSTEWFAWSWDGALVSLCD
jgi:hypothetical protein